MTQRQFHIYPSRRNAIKMMLRGLLYLGAGALTLISFNLSAKIDKLKNGDSSQTYFYVLYIAFVFAPVIFGLFIILVNAIRISKRHPLITLDKKGISLLRHKEWGPIRWDEIAHINFESRKPRYQDELEDCLILHLTEPKKMQVYSQDAAIRLNEIDFDPQELMKLMTSLWRSSHSMK